MQHKYNLPPTGFDYSNDMTRDKLNIPQQIGSVDKRQRHEEMTTDKQAELISGSDSIGLTN